MRIATVTATRRPWMWPHLVAGLAAQTRRADVSIVIVHAIEPGPLVALAPSLIVEEAPSAWKLGRLLNAGLREAFRLGADVACIWDDDDRYDPGYLASVERAIGEHPDAWLVGKHAHWTEFPDEPDRKPVEYVAPSHADGRAHWLAGPTIAIPRATWDRGLRYRDDAPIPDGPLLQDAAALWLASGGKDGEWPPFYSTGSDGFALRRFSATHGHAWADPR